jgi:hypothetical protein
VTVVELRPGTHLCRSHLIRLYNSVSILARHMDQLHLSVGCTRTRGLPPGLIGTTVFLAPERSRFGPFFWASFGSVPPTCYTISGS